MSDFSATFATDNNCTGLNTGGVSALCADSQTCGNSLRNLNRGRRARARRSFVAGANCCSGHVNVLVARR